MQAAYFLLDVPGENGEGGAGSQAGKPPPNVEQFVTETLRNLLLHLSRATERHQIEYRGQVRGRILWSNTLKARCSDDYDPTRYVCQQLHTQYDTPENQLLKYVVKLLLDCLEELPPSLRAGTCLPARDPAEGPVRIARRLEPMEAMLEQVQRNVLWRAISTPSFLSELHLLRAETSRFEEYAEVVALYRRHQQVVLRGRWEQIAEVGRRVLLLPACTGPGEERWIRLGAALLHHAGRGAGDGLVDGMQPAGAAG
jgi:type VI protein secretion system component VasA